MYDQRSDSIKGEPDFIKFNMQVVCSRPFCIPESHYELQFITRNRLTSRLLQTGLINYQW